MTLREILKNTLQMFEDYFGNSLSSLVREDLIQQVINHEESLTWAELQSLLSESDLDSGINDFDGQQLETLLSPFKKFLEQRWERIKDFPQLCYTKNTRTPLTLVCETLATELANTYAFLHKKEEGQEEIEPLHRYEFLMPGINFENKVLRMNLNVLDGFERLKLHHFILDDENRIIHIYESLYQAQHDLEFFHYSALSVIGTKLRLSKKDQLRVCYHSKQSMEVWKQIEAFHNFQLATNTVGAALARLAVGLMKGGVRGEGSEKAASEAAYIAIEAFYYYIQSLHLNLREDILNLSHNDTMLGSFRYSWYKLLYACSLCRDNFVPEDEMKVIGEYLDQIDSDRERALSGVGLNSYNCVDALSDVIEKILKLNRKLFEVFDTATAYKPDLVKLARSNVDIDGFFQVDEALRTAFRNLISANKLNRLDYFNHLELRALQSPIKDALFLDGNAYIKPFARNLLKTSMQFIILLNHTNFYFHRELIGNILKRRIISKLFKSAKELIEGLQALVLLPFSDQTYKTIDMIFNILGKKKLHKLFKETGDLIALKNVLDFANYLPFLSITLGIQKVKEILGDEKQIKDFIKTFPKEHQKTLYDFFQVKLEIAVVVNALPSLGLFSFFNSRASSSKLTNARDEDDGENRSRKRTHV